MEQDEPPQVRTAEEPFNKAAADTILRSSDRVDYRIRRSILAEASPFFEDMFSLPQLGGKRKRQGTDDEYVDGKPVIGVSETSKTLRSLLLFCYPCRDPVLQDGTEVCDVLEAAHKYDMQDIADRVHEQFVERVETTPYEMYALAYKHGWRDRMQIAAKASLACPEPVRYPEILETLPTGTFLRLQWYCKACSATAQQALEPLIFRGEAALRMGWITRHDFETRCFFRCEDICWIPTIVSHCYFAKSASTGFEEEVALPEWILESIPLFQQELHKTPRGCALTRAELVAKIASLNKSTCPFCCDMTYPNAENFAAVLAERIEHVASEVSHW